MFSRFSALSSSMPLYVPITRMPLFSPYIFAVIIKFYHVQAYAICTFIRFVSNMNLLRAKCAELWIMLKKNVDSWNTFRTKSGPCWILWLIHSCLFVSPSHCVCVWIFRIWLTLQSDKCWIFLSHSSNYDDDDSDHHHHHNHRNSWETDFFILEALFMYEKAFRGKHAQFIWLHSLKF